MSSVSVWNQISDHETTSHTPVNKIIIIIFF